MIVEDFIYYLLIIQDKDFYLIYFIKKVMACLIEFKVHYHLRNF